MRAEGVQHSDTQCRHLFGPKEMNREEKGGKHGNLKKLTISGLRSTHLNEL